jgi:hypothetical protein
MTAPQPFNLRASVSVKDIAFVILKIPRDNYKDITFGSRLSFLSFP